MSEMRAADGRNKPALHMIVAGLAIILVYFDSVAPSICGYARLWL